MVSSTVWAVIAFVLFLALLVVFTIALKWWVNAGSCAANPDFWCWDDWYCPNVNKVVPDPNDPTKDIDLKRPNDLLKAAALACRDVSKKCNIPGVGLKGTGAGY